MRKEVIGNATLYLGDSAEVLPTLGAVDAVITSPPYGQQRDYGKKILDWDGLMRGVFGGLQPAETCQVLVNLGQIHRDGEVVPYWEPWREWMRSLGWRFFGWYVWDQGDGMPGDWNGRLAPSHEYVFHFNKSAVKVNKWTRAKSAGAILHSGGIRSADGSVKKKTHDGRPVGETKVADSVLRIYREMRRGIEHPAVYPVRLPEELAMSFTGAAATILDPFMGSGTTGVACANLGRKFIGVELDPGYFDSACRRIEDAHRQRRMFA